MSNEEYILQHREEDVRQLALHKAADGVDRKWCLQQIEGWQLARRKLPHWAQTAGLWFPPRLAMEQCSSEATARYKAALTERLIPPGERQLMADLTGGFGVDFSFMAPLFQRRVYVEIQPQLIEIARHNMPLLGLSDASIAAPGNSALLASHFSLLFVDPSRRDLAGRKTVSIEDCTPNILDLQDELLQQTSWLIVKFSPMLDIHEALRKLNSVREVHVVSSGGECKELLFVMQGSQASTGEEHPAASRPLGRASDGAVLHCVNLGTEEDEITVPLESHVKGRDVPAPASPQEEPKKRQPSPLPPRQSYPLPSRQPYPLPSRQPYPLPSRQPSPLPPGEEARGLYLYEPNASILKAGISDVLTERYPVWKLHPMSHLFVGQTLLPRFPGRRFQITDWSDFGKQKMRDFIENFRHDHTPDNKGKSSTSSVSQGSKKGRLKANLTVRNFPTSVDSLRRKLRLDEGGDVYLFATTLSDGRHVLIRCLKA